MTDFAKEVRTRRTALGLSQEELGEFAGFSRGTIRNIEAGKPLMERTIGAVRAALDRAETGRARRDSGKCNCSAEVDELAQELADERIAHQQTLAVLRAIRALIDAIGGAS